ncbi:MAG: tRNA epoxyqueuosine(34) reductase QueG [Chromatiales bacterium]|jgi:epoxyqueuosine reductase|nr:tRNA epoxyqueuosine(34) reductase QueG [Chromatiales bacterium]
MPRQKPSSLADDHAEQQRTQDAWHALAEQIREWSASLGFAKVGITSTQLDADEARLLEWLGKGRHGSMHYMARHGSRRARPHELVPGTIRIISVRMDYWPVEGADPWSVLGAADQGYISRYALGRDYHKSMRRRLQRLADKIEMEVGPFGYRAFVDSAPVLEKALARNAGLGWIGKHTNLLSRDAGSWFFLGELFTDLPLPISSSATAHCGQCDACIQACPTGAIVGPYELDARRCISYLTIEHRGSIPEHLRPMMGNRIYGCDDCQLVCPWNRFSSPSNDSDHLVRHALDAPELLSLFAWSADEFAKRLEGNAIRRIGYECWLRNIAVALGNAPSQHNIVTSLLARADDASTLVREHVRWALRQHGVTPEGAVRE